MSFDIVVGEKTIEQNGEPVNRGEFLLCGCKEEFALPVSYWSRYDYFKNWKRMVADGLGSQANSAIVTSMRDPRYMNFINLWAFYYGGENVYVQNKILFMDEIEGRFNPNRMNSYLGERITLNEDGVRISEWVVKLDDVLSGFQAL
jgi:hypothetical protein